MYVILRVLHYSRRTSFFVGIALSQVSEFSLILLAVGQEAGHVSGDTVALMTFVAIGSIILSSYLILYSSRVYPYVGKFLSAFTFFEEGIDVRAVREKYDAILFGYHRAGTYVIDVYKKHGLKYLIVDFDPEAIKRLQSEGEPYLYGDVEDLEFLEDIHISQSRVVVSTVPDTQANAVLAQFLRKNNFKGSLMVVASTAPQANELYEAGASYVLMPHHVGLYEGARKINTYLLDGTYFDRERERHLKQLEEMKF
jgi:voltage-gated potassium channel Kch